jgi:hypothetical protein
MVEPCAPTPLVPEPGLSVPTSSEQGPGTPGTEPPPLAAEDSSDLLELEQLEATDLNRWQEFVTDPKRKACVLAARSLRTLNKSKLLRYYLNAIVQRFTCANSKPSIVDVHWLIHLTNTLVERCASQLYSEEPENQDQHMLNAMRLAIRTVSGAGAAVIQAWIPAMRSGTMACLLALGAAPDRLAGALLDRVVREPYQESEYALAIGALARNAPRALLLHEALVQRNPAAIDAIMCMRERLASAGNSTATIQANATAETGSDEQLSHCTWLDALTRLARNEFALYALGLDTRVTAEDEERLRLDTVERIRAAFDSPDVSLRAGAALAAVEALRSGQARHPSELSIPTSLKPLLIEIIRRTKRKRDDEVS